MAERRCIFGRSFGEISILPRIGRPVYWVEEKLVLSQIGKRKVGERKMRSPDKCFHKDIYSYMRVDELIHDSMSGFVSVCGYI